MSNFDKKDSDNEMLPEYDFSQGVRGKHVRDMGQGYSVTIHNADGTKTVKEYAPVEGVVILDPDVQKYFPDSESVNRILRDLISILPQTGEQSS